MLQIEDGPYINEGGPIHLDSAKVPCDEDCEKFGDKVRFGFYIMFLSLIPLGILLYALE